MTEFMDQFVPYHLDRINWVDSAEKTRFHRPNKFHFFTSIDIQFVTRFKTKYTYMEEKEKKTCNKKVESRNNYVQSKKSGKLSV